MGVSRVSPSARRVADERRGWEGAWLEGGRGQGVKEAGPEEPQGRGRKQLVDVEKPTGRGVTRAAGGAGEASPVAASHRDRPTGVRLYATAQAPLTLSRRHSSGSRFSAAIASQRHSNRTKLSSSLDAAITTRRYPTPSVGDILMEGGSAFS